MNFYNLPLLMAAPPAGAEAQGGSLVGSLIPFVLIIGIFYLLIIRPQSKKRKETEKMLGALKKGDKIVTIGGLYGVITSIKESTVIIKVDDNTKLEFLRSAVSSVISAAKEKEEKEEKTEDTSDGE